MKVTKDMLQEIYTNKATVYTLKEFIEYVDVGAFKDGQGKPIFLDENGAEVKSIVCSCNAKFLKKYKFKYKFVVWYDKE